MTGNYFLDALEPADGRAVLDILRPVELKDGERLIAQDALVTTIHFPLRARLSNITTSPDGAHLETAVVGREGLSGLAPFMADVPSAWQVVCTVGGDALACSADALRILSRRRERLQDRLLGLTHFYQAQANQLALCNTYHRAAPRLARWLLTTSDLAGTSELNLTQEQIANALGIQRTSVVGAFAKLKAANLIRHTRSRLHIVDRSGLRGRACGCYDQLHDLATEMGILPRNP